IRCSGPLSLPVIHEIARHRTSGFGSFCVEALELVQTDRLFSADGTTTIDRMALGRELLPVRVKKTRQKKESRAPFRFNRNGALVHCLTVCRRLAAARSCWRAGRSRGISESSMRNNPIIVQKYGGACLETPAKIRAVAGS